MFKNVDWTKSMYLPFQYIIKDHKVNSKSQWKKVSQKTHCNTKAFDEAYRHLFNYRLACIPTDKGQWNHSHLYL